MEDIADLSHRHNAGKFKEVLATYRKAEDLINIGAYTAGSNPKIDYAISKINDINNYLKQGIDTEVTLENSIQDLESIMN